MFFKKGLCFFLFVTAVLLLATTPSRCQRENFDRIRVDGTQPPPPPIPWPSGNSRRFRSLMGHNLLHRRYLGQTAQSESQHS